MKQKKHEITHSLIKIWAVALVIILMTSCGAAKIAYNSLDIIIPWFLDDYITFDETQEHKIASMLSQQLEWHRTTQLPGYINLLDEIQEDIKSDVSKEQVIGYYNTTQKMWLVMVIKLTPDIANVLTTLEDDQVKEMFQSLEYENEKLESEFVDLSIEEMHEGRIERMNERFERWLDELTSQQQKAIVAWSYELKPINEFWLDNRAKWYNEFKTSLSLRDNYRPFYNKLHHLFVYYEDLRTEAYISALKYNQEKTIDLIIDVEHQITDEQRKYLTDEIEDIKQDLIELNNDTS